MEAAPRLAFRQVLWSVALFVALDLGGYGALTGARMPYVLTNELRADPVALARFNQLVALPATLGLLYGYLRDRGALLGLGDRGLVLAFAPLVLLATLWPAVAGLGYVSLLVSIVAAAVAGGMVGAAINGTVAVMGQRLSATAGIAGTMLAIGALVGSVGQELGAALSSWPFAANLVLAAGFEAVLFLLVLRPASGAFPPRERIVGNHENPVRALRHLLRSRPYLAALAFFMLWNYTPFVLTPLQLHLKNDLRFDESQFAHFFVLVNLGLVPASLGYPLLVRRFGRRQIALAFVALSVPGALAFLVAPGPVAIYAAGLLGGLTSGTLNAAAFDGLLRAVPKGLEGSGLALPGTLLVLVNAVSDPLVTGLASRHGFAVSVWISLVPQILLLVLIQKPVRDDFATL